MAAVGHTAFLPPMEFPAQLSSSEKEGEEGTSPEEPSSSETGEVGW